MKLPGCVWYTVETLAEELGCSVSKVNHYIEAGKLKLSARFTHIDIVGDIWTGCPSEDYADDWATLNGNGYEFKGEYVRLKDVELFEKTYCQVVGDNQGKIHPENQVHETDSEMVKRLKKEGLENKQIAHKLKDIFPNIRPSRIGRLITEDPKVYVTNEAYRGRGRRLLKDYDPLNKPTL